MELLARILHDEPDGTMHWSARDFKDFSDPISVTFYCAASLFKRLRAVNDLYFVRKCRSGGARRFRCASACRKARATQASWGLAAASEACARPAYADGLKLPESD